MASMASVAVNSPNVRYSEDAITATYKYQTAHVSSAEGNDGIVVTPVEKCFTFRTERHVPRVGLMMVGVSGNNGTTLAAGIAANRRRLQWQTKEGTLTANWYGSLTLASTMKVGVDSSGNEVYVPVHRMLPVSHPEDWVVGGWDINSMPLGDAMRRAKVLDIGIQTQLYDELQQMKPLPGIYLSDFIAENQRQRADNTIKGTKAEMVATVRQNIQNFKKTNNLDKVIVLWTATTERFQDVAKGLNDTKESLLAAIDKDEPEISASTLYAVAAILENCSYINGSPQNTFVPGVIDLAMSRGVFIAGDDFKSGQTKLKSVLVDFLVSAGIKPVSVVSYNHLGNNDGMNLMMPPQFMSKEISKRGVVDDMVESNKILYKPGERPDHVVVIKYVPAVGDSKRAMDEYTSEIFMGGHNTLVVHNTCEDSLLAAPLMADLVILAELFERIRIKEGSYDDTNVAYEKMHTILSALGYLCKAPLQPHGAPVKNALFAQRECILNIIRACVGLAPENHMLLEDKLNNRPTTFTYPSAVSSSNKTTAAMMMEEQDVHSSPNDGKAIKTIKTATAAPPVSTH